MKSHAAAAESADTRATTTNTAKSTDTGAAATADSTANSTGMRAAAAMTASSAAAATAMPATTAAATTTAAAMTASCRDFHALAKRGLVIEDAEGRQADVKDLFLAQNNLPRRVVRRCMRWRRVC
jgi:hypothetical protein